MCSTYIAKTYGTYGKIYLLTGKNKQMSDFTTIASLAIILLAAIVHASFQLSISVLTLLSGHALGSSTAHHRLVRLSSGYIAGVGVMTVLLLSTLSLFLALLLPEKLR